MSSFPYCRSIKCSIYLQSDSENTLPNALHPVQNPLLLEEELTACNKNETVVNITESKATLLSRSNSTAASPQLSLKIKVKISH